jgi:hypothetical protein
MLGVNGGAAGTGFQGPAQANQQGMNNLQTSYAQLQALAAGQGPNPAQLQYQQNISDLAKQQAGAIGSIQGISPALAARMATQQGSAAAQNAAAAGVTAESNQQLGAMQGAAAVGGAQANAANQQQASMNTANASLAGTQMQGQQGLVGGIMSGFGATKSLIPAAPGFAEGGVVPSGPSNFSNFMNGLPPLSLNGSQQPVQTSPYPNAGVSGFKQGLGGYAKGGRVPAMVSPGELWLTPSKVQAVAKGKNALKIGEKIPGVPKVAGNSYANDVVPKSVQPGGIFIPNSIMQSPDPAGGAHDFVTRIIANRGRGA